MKVYLVGGAIRDQLLGLHVNERDYVVVGTTSEHMLSMGYQKVGKDFPVFLHPKTHEEYALARTERKTGQGYYGFTCEFNESTTLEEDLKRRDLTINAMAQDESGHIIDPYNGMDDLKNKLLRHVSSAFFDDPLRVLRIARFQAKLPDFRIAPDTYHMLVDMVKNPDFPTLSSERMYLELQKSLITPAPWLFLKTLEDIGGLKWILPEANIERLTQQLQQTLPLAKSQRFFALSYGQSSDALNTLKKLPLSRLEQYLLKTHEPLQHLHKQPSLENFVTCLQKLDALRKREWAAIALEASDQLYHTHYLKQTKSLWTLWDEQSFPSHLQGQSGDVIRAFYETRLYSLAQTIYNNKNI